SPPLLSGELAADFGAERAGDAVERDAPGKVEVAFELGGVDLAAPIARLVQVEAPPPDVAAGRLHQLHQAAGESARRAAGATEADGLDVDLEHRVDVEGRQPLVVELLSALVHE